MPTMPTRDSLPNLRTQASTGIAQAPRDFIGPALQQTGDLITQVGEKQKQQLDTSDLIKARADWRSALITQSAQADTHVNPDPTKWGSNFIGGIEPQRQKVAAGIHNPILRERFLNETSPDVLAQGYQIKDKAEKQIDSNVLTNLQTSELKMLDAATDPALTPDEVATMIADHKASIIAAVDAGSLSAPKAAQSNIEFTQKIKAIRTDVAVKSLQGAALTAQNHVKDHPEDLAKTQMDYIAQVNATPYMSEAAKTAEITKAREGFFGATLSGLIGKGQYNQARQFMQQRTSDNVVDRIIAAESGGDPNASNPASSASGLGQFTDGTWIATVRKHHPELAHQSDATILGLKSDADVQRQVLGELTKDNIAFLKSHGLPVTDGTIYLAHFAGPGGAQKILQAAPDTSIEAVLGQKAVDANPFLKGKTAAEVRDWAAQKMGAAKGANYSDVITPNLRDTWTSAINTAENTSNSIIETEQARALTDQAVKLYPTDLAGQEKYIKETGKGNPKAVEKALTLADAENKRNAEAAKADNIAKYADTYEQVRKSVEAGAPAADTQQIINKSGLSVEQQQKLLGIVKSGPISVDSPASLAAYNDAYLNNKMADFNVNQFVGTVTNDTIKRWKDEVTAAQKAKAEGLDSASNILKGKLNDYYTILGIATGTSADAAASAPAKAALDRLVVENARTKIAAVGRALTNEESQQVIDSSIISFRQKVHPWYSPGGIFGSTTETSGFVDVADKFTQAESDYPDAVPPGTLFQEAIAAHTQAVQNWVAGGRQGPAPGALSPEVLNAWVDNWTAHQQQLSDLPAAQAPQ